MISATVTGRVELQRALAALPSAVRPSVQAAALTVGAEPFRARASEQAPRAPGRGPHLADNIAIGAPIVSDGLVTVEVGPERRPDNVFHGYFQEFGTSHHAPQSFMRPAFYGRWRQAAGLVMAHLWAAVRSAARG